MMIQVALILAFQLKDSSKLILLDSESKGCYEEISLVIYYNKFQS